jgi:hypothetical protein
VKIVVAVVAVLLGLLSIAAGVAKIALLPDEVAFLSQFGFGTLLIAFFGTVQFLGGILLVIPRTRSPGALVAALAFGLSAVLLLVAGNSAFAGVSLVPAILAGLIAYRGFSAA